VAYGPSEEEIMAGLLRGAEMAGRAERADFDLINEIAATDEICAPARAAITTALLHKLSGDSGQYPWEILGIDPPEEIRTSFTVSIDDPERMLAEIKACGYPIIKIKAGFDGDEQLIQKLRDIPGKLFRVDANGAWSMEKTEKMLYYLNRAPVELLEQPTAIGDIIHWKYLKRQSKINLILDEGLNDLEDYYRYADYLDGINIKPAKSGGVIEALRLARRAGRDHRRVMFGCMVESSVGISPAVYMSSLAQYFDLDGPLLLKDDIADEIDFMLDIITVDENIIGGPKIKSEISRDQTA